MNTHHLQKIAISLLLGGVFSVTQNPAMALTVAQSPLTTGSSEVLPNIMLMLDNSISMVTNNVSTTSVQVPVTPDDMPSGTTTSCAPARIVSAGGTSIATAVSVQMRNNGGTIQFMLSASTPNFGTAGSNKCFNVAQFYTVTDSNGQAFGTFVGNKLNWYFSSPHVFSTTTLVTTTTKTITVNLNRLDVAKSAAQGLINSLKPATVNDPVTVRLGLSIYNHSYDTLTANTTRDRYVAGKGGALVVPIADLDTSQATNINNAIGAIGTANSSGNYVYYLGYTPLAETLTDIGRYFALSSAVNVSANAKINQASDTSTLLTLYPQSSTQAASIGTIADIFGTGKGLLNKTLPAVTNFEPPVQNYCQQNAVILVTDGIPSYDREITASLRDYLKDCSLRSLCDAAPTAGFGSTTPTNPESGGYFNQSVAFSSGHNPSGDTCKETDTPYNLSCKNGTLAGYKYDNNYGSDYLDDVANAMFKMDLLPSLNDTDNNPVKNNLRVFGIGIFDNELVAGGVVERTALAGGGRYAKATSSAQLSSILSAMVEEIKKGTGSFSAIAANSTQLDENAALFQAKYDSNDWSGDLVALPLTLDESTGAVSIGSAAWSAATNMPSSSNRVIYTHNGTAGVLFNQANYCSNLSEAQRVLLRGGASVTSCGDSTDQGVWLLNYLRGDITHEQANPAYKLSYSTTDERLTTNLTGRIYRSRTRFYGVNPPTGHYEGERMTPDPWLLGDIVNSDPAYVGESNSNYDQMLPSTATTEKDSYAAFVTAKASRTPMIYVGANDGMLHGFDATITGTDAGKEKLAYVPTSVFANLTEFASPSYVHKYFVDGSPRVGDVFFNTPNTPSNCVTPDNNWHTVLVGTTGAGGKGVFALDVTCPNAFASSNPVLWEINELNASFPDLGYTLPYAAIGRLNNGKWAAIIANGYGSSNHKAVLYIVNIQTGALIKAIDTGATGTTNAPNGLSTPVAADVDDNGTIDAVYAGDLLGNLWKFDLSAADPNDAQDGWDVAYSSGNNPAPMFTASQPITAKPQVSGVGSGQTTGGVMVYFGTGKYFEKTDVTSTATQTFYGIWDECPLAVDGHTNCSTISSSTLQQQSIENDGDPNVRVTTNNTVNYASQKGWYINLIDNGVTNGERVLGVPLLRGGHIVFVTFMPKDPNAESSCDASTSGWLMELEALTGSRPSAPVLDINGSYSIDSTDVVAFGGLNVPASGSKITNGNSKPPVVLENPNPSPTTGCEYKFMGDSKAKTPQQQAEGCPTSGSSTSGGRQSWRQL